MIVTLFWLVEKWKFLSLFEFKGDIRIFFSCSYYEIWRKPLTEDFIRGLMIFEIILILKFFFRIWGFRRIGNIFGWGSVFEEIVGWRESRTDIHSRIFTDCCWKQFYRRIRRPMKLLRAYLASIFLVWSSEDEIKEKRRGLLQNFVDDVYVFQSGWCFGFVCDLAKWNEFGKVEVPIYW